MTEREPPSGPHASATEAPRRVRSLLGPSAFWRLGVAVLAVVALTFRPVVQGDGVGYYSYLQAVLVDHTRWAESGP